MTTQQPSITFKEDLVVKQDKPQPTSLNQEDKDLTNYVELCQSDKPLDTKEFFTLVKSSQQIKLISSK